MSDKIFVEGMMIEPKGIVTAPWIKAGLYIRVDDAIKFLEKYKNERGFVNIDIKESKNGRWYCELNTFKPQKIEKPDALKEIDPNDVPF